MTSHNLLKIFMPLLGKNKRQIYAAKAIVLLLELALEKRTATYGQIAKRLNVANPRQVAGIISLAGEVINDFFQGQCPEICALVVSAATGVPGGGYFEEEPEQTLYQGLSRAEKKAFMQVKWGEVYHFAQWEELLPYARSFCRYYL